MTNEEAIEILRGAIKHPNTEDGYLGQAITMAVKSLEAQLCEDCISRQMAIEAMGEQPLNWTNSSREIAEEMMWEDHVKALKELPSVTPARARGKWLLWTDDRKDYAKCSCCDYGEEGEVLWKDTTKFCPNCGADMRGGENDQDI